MPSTPASTEEQIQAMSTAPTEEIPHHDRQLTDPNISNEEPNPAPVTICSHQPTDIAPLEPTTEDVGTMIPLQPLSPLDSTACTTCLRRSTDSHPSEGVSSGGPSYKRTKNISDWLWNKGCALWAWVTSIVMTALTAVTYLVTKVSNCDQVRQAWEISAQAWENRKDFYDYCLEQKRSAERLADSCREVLSKGLSAPPNPPPEKCDNKNERRSIPDSNQPRFPYLEELYTKAKRAVREIETQISTAVDMLGRDIMNPEVYVGGGSLRRRPGW